MGIHFICYSGTHQISTNKVIDVFSPCDKTTLGGGVGKRAARATSFLRRSGGIVADDRHH